MKEHAREFGIMLLGLAEIYNRTLSEASVTLYYNALKQYDFEDVNNAINIIVRQSRFMPSISEIIDIIENKQTPDALAEQAYNKLIRARKEVGAYASIVFDDPIIHRIIEQHGGWPAVCAMTKDDEQFTAFKKNFIQEYKAFMHDKNYKYPKELAGICDIYNNAAGFDNHIPPPVIFGDKNKAIEWINKQNELDKKDKHPKRIDRNVINDINALADNMTNK